jgi:hypothetical protein
MAKNSKKRGRPQKQGVRYPSGKLKPVDDLGTPEAQARRIALAKYLDVDKHGNKFWRIGDPAMTENALDTLLTNQTITPEQHAAGVTFGKHYRAVFGRADGCRAALGELPESELERITKEIKAQIQAMRRLSSAHYNLVRGICAFGHRPHWLAVEVRLPRHQAKINKLIVGLDTIGGAAKVRAPKARAVRADQMEAA